MKKILAIFISLLAISSLAKAQPGGFIGGGITVFYAGTFTYQTTVHGGYAFNDKFAVMAMGGIAASVDEGDGYVVGETGAYVRFTPWHNDVLYIDIKPRVELAFSSEIEAVDIGIVPSLRFRVSPKFEIYTDVASLGARYTGYSWKPCVGITNVGATVGVNYLF